MRRPSSLRAGMFCRLGSVDDSLPGGGDRLLIGSVHAAGARVDGLRQLVGVGALELGEHAVFEDHARQVVLVGQLLQHLLVGGGLALGRLVHHRQAQPVEQDLLQLLGRGEVERSARTFMRLPLQRVHAGRKLVAHAPEQGHVDPHAMALDAHQHRQQGHLDGLVHPPQPRLCGQSRPQHLMQAQGDVGILGGVVGRHFDAHGRERDLLGALARHVLVFDVLVIEVTAGQGIEVMAILPGIQNVGFEQGVMGDARERDAVIGQHMGVVFQVLADLGVLGTFQQRLEAGQHGGAVELVRHAGVAVRERDVDRLAGLDGEGDADDLRLHGVEAGGLGIEGDQLGLFEALEPVAQGPLVQNGAISPSPLRGEGLGRG